MNKTIYKYQLNTITNQTIKLPIGAEILTIQAQYDDPCIWCLVDPSIINTEDRHIEIYGTGHDIIYDMGVDRKYIGSYQLLDGSFIGHAFERIN